MSDLRTWQLHGRPGSQIEAQNRSLGVMRMNVRHLWLLCNTRVNQLSTSPFPSLPESNTIPEQAKYRSTRVDGTRPVSDKSKT